MAISKQVTVVLVVVLILGACFTDGRRRGGRYSGGSRRRPTEISGLSRCYLSGAYPCYGSGLSVRCYYEHQVCDGYPNCPYGDDEYICGTTIRPTRVVYSTRTELRTTTRTTTSTISTTSSTSTTSTTTSTTTTTLTSTQSLLAYLPFPNTGTVVTSSFTTTVTFMTLTPIMIGANIAEGVAYCENLVAVGNVIAGVARISANTVTPTVSFTGTASVTCSPTTTIYSTAP